MIDVLDFLRDFTGWVMVVFMWLWLLQRREWVRFLGNGMRLDAHAVQSMAAAMIFSILGWQMLFDDVGSIAGGASWQFVLFAIVMRAWLAGCAMAAVIANYRTRYGWPYKRCFWQVFGWVIIALGFTVA